MASMTAHLTFTVPLTARNRQVADRLRRQYSNPEKANYAYRQVLALYAVNAYCQCMEIEADLGESQIWNAPLRPLCQSADLPVSGQGAIECCPVSEDGTSVSVAPEVWSDRLGYIAVRFSSTYDEAQLVGFRETVSEEIVPLEAWHSLDNFLDCFDPVGDPALETLVSSVVRLDRWLQNCFEGDWEAIGSVLASRSLGLAFRKATEERWVERVKTIDLSRKDETVLLLVGLSTTSTTEIDVWVHVTPQDPGRQLPHHLQVEILDEKDETVMQACARGTQTLQLDFSIEPDEIFKVRVELEDFTIVETFSI
ncbi:DUF1822 family protein [Baaleninema simplex]|uniref:DUF1822 family protein n=1 Tax=Baaleninema simplex TaxID=2862350 RepID=UPI000A00620F|nr:DUF1822 family protein [Baaleninema simplex]